MCIHLLPPSTLIASPRSSTLAEAVQKLNVLNSLLSAANYTSFWSSLRRDDLYADLVAEVSGFEELMRVRIAATVSQAVREVERPILEDWLDLRGNEFQKFVGDVCGWSVEGGTVKVPMNKENEAKGTVVRENVKFDREFVSCALWIMLMIVQNSRELSEERMSSRHDSSRACLPGSKINEMMKRARKGHWEA